MQRFPRLAAIALALSASRTPANAQPPACDPILLNHTVVKGLNPALLTYPVSSLNIPTLGFATTDMANAIDPLVGNYMNKNGAAGGTVTMTYNNQLIFAKSYGYADVTNQLLAEPDSRFRIASVTKSLTAMGILKLVHDDIALEVGGGGWQLNYQPFNPPGFGSPIGGTRQTWIEPATVSDLLYHEGGWEEDYENYHNLMAVETVMGTPGPPDCHTLLRYVESRPMTTADFTPGNGQIYSNVGYCALGETIRQLSGASSYFDYMQTNVLSPLGMNDTQLGSSKHGEQLDREAVYYPCGYVSSRVPPVMPIPRNYGVPPIEGKSLFPPHGTVSAAYGGGVHTFSLQASEGAGGMVSTSIDLARFTGAIASGQLPNFQGDILHPGWPQNFYSYSAAASSYEIAQGLTNYYFGMGWDWVQPNAISPPPIPSYDYNNNFEKTGLLPGTTSGIAVTADGYSFAAVFNGDAADATQIAPDEIFWIHGTALQAAYNHASSQPWNFDFFPQYAQVYTSWMPEPAFKSYLATQESSGSYPSRLEGRTIESGTPRETVVQYRARFAQKLATGSAAPQVMYGQSCSAMLAAVESAPASTPLVSLQRYADPNSSAYLYQAVWSAPIPQLPGN